MVQKKKPKDWHEKHGVNRSVGRNWYDVKPHVHDLTYTEDTATCECGAVGYRIIPLTLGEGMHIKLRGNPLSRRK